MKSAEKIIKYGAGILAACAALMDKRTPVWAKITGIIGIIYVVNPFDILPDAILLTGWIDDTILLMIALNLIFFLVPKDVREEYRGKKKT